MADDAITVSMYNVGFGDCFLLRLPGGERERRVLIDCGSIKRGIEGGTDAVVAQLINDVTDDDGARIDVVVASHRHRDHVSGFADPAWRDVAVEEVWLPWTENPDDDDAVRILNEMASFAASLAEEQPRLRGLSVDQEQLLGHVIDNTLGLSNEPAMATLHRGFRDGRNGARRRFLPERETGSIGCPALPGVTVHVLGPSRDEAVIRDMDPPSDEGFLRLAGHGLDGNGDRGQVFPDWPVENFEDRYPLPERLRERLERMSIEAAVLGAVALEKAVNNTSLMLAFEIGESVLLFPGDSQWGTWELNLDDPRVTDLLRRTKFYKVGHHGSHNATPTRFVRQVLPDAGPVVAAVSVTPHGRFTEIPEPKLIEALGERIGPKRVVRSDQPPIEDRDGSEVRVIPAADSAAHNGDEDAAGEDEAKAIRIDFTIPIG
ncbi:MAG: hypothetical protein GY724_14365 [Actinomycetia bacterium]|nr:hypothetical protein [Actinomycetes bacterium]MCP4224830.1 hypothetical protein [Actinomycetes bacterium]MCP5030936.1 hypothetical protein [Actinomycetes bacterium]